MPVVKFLPTVVDVTVFQMPIGDALNCLLFAFGLFCDSSL